MNEELQLSLQAYLDGELSPKDARAVAARIESDPGARSLHSELQQTRALLRGNEMDRRIPQTREFFWSQIEREISRQEVRTARASVPWWLEFLRRHLGAVSGAGVALALLVLGAVQLNLVSGDMLEEIDNPLDETTSFSFRSESQKMTIVWIANPSSTKAEDEPDPGEETVQ
jgi:anti-sigma factor RsiW